MGGADIIILVLGLLLAGFGVFRFAKRANLKKKCTAQTAGTLYGTKPFEVQNMTSGLAPGQANTYTYIRINYSVEGAAFEKILRISKRECSILDQDAGVTVFFDPSAPKRCYISELRLNPVPPIFFIIGGALLIWVYLAP